MSMNLSKLMQSTGKSCSVQGLWGSSLGWFLSEWVKHYKYPAIIVTKGPREAEKNFWDLQSFYGKDTAIFPELEPGMLDLVGEQWNILENFPTFTITTLKGIKQKVIPPDQLPNVRFEIGKGEKILRNELFEWLIDNDYERTDCVEQKGEFGHRGGIIDVYPPNTEWPIRIELTGDIVDSIRLFHPQTQCSLPAEQNITNYIYPVACKKYTDKFVTLEEYLPDKGFIILDELPEQKEQMKSKNIILITELIRDVKGIGVEINSLEYLTAEKKTPDSLTVARKHTFDQIIKWQKEQYEINIWCNNVGEKGRLEELLKENRIKIADKICLQIGRISSGFVYPEEKLVVISDEEIFGRYKVRLPKRKFKGYGVPLKVFTELKPGDYVVHINHGIGKFLGIQKEKEREMLIIQYANRSKLYVPIEESHLIERFLGLGGRLPKLSVLGGLRWAKTKKNVDRALQDVAAELLELQAKRQSLPGISFSRDTLWQKEMEDSFIYEETPDQLQATDEVKQDMERKRPMDRLLCGDVGYGKTEVAIRAAFKAVMYGKQVAVLVPTTVLAQQHYRTFCDRLADYPVHVEMLSRFRSKKEQKIIVDEISKGKIDILIGTHRLIQPDVRFKDLGLVIIDEEQRFGVKHKEKLKKFRTSVDVLTLTATPIPRTLYMSLVGIKEMSVINTPPQDRLAVHTVVAEYNDKLIRDAILKEISREGQVYFVHNRVETIEKVADKMKKLIPEAKFITAHGQMDEDLLSLVMDEFVNGGVHVLVCTTIIQSGLDIPNVNTILIDNADRFGLADLYQLRGRVGRFKHQAYSYLLLTRNKILTGIAKKRLKAIQDFSHLGAGFKVAMQDLEIRGAGNLLGNQQHGHIQAVGFDLYCKLLHKNVLILQGKPVKRTYEVILCLDINGYIPIEYIPIDRMRIDFYKRIACVLEEKELDEIIKELKDRFGALPEPLKILVELVKMKLLSMKAELKEIRFKENKLHIVALGGRRIVEEIPKTVKDKLKWLKKRIYDIIKNQ